MLFERREFIEMLYNTLPGKSRVRTGQNITSIHQDDNGVEVHLANGQAERGDIVIGADGVYSYVRDVMWEHLSNLSETTSKKIGQPYNVSSLELIS
jgi:2-polyprenyl-6-methoxyphenol hydroxylase-like FAD-dependent oxidoreductase